MPKAFEQVAKDALELTPRQRCMLAEFPLESAGSVGDPEADAAWDVEIRDRIRAIDEGHVVGISYEDVIREPERRLGS